MDNRQTIDQTAIWKALAQHQKSFDQRSLKDLFSSDADRGEHFAVEAAGIYFDYSKNHLTEDTLALLEELAQKVDLDQHITALFHGAHVNQSEDRPALHTALRRNFRRADASSKPPLNKHITDKIDQSLTQTLEFAEALRNGSVLGSQGQIITDVVNIGIGGSDLGSRLVVEALDRRAQTPGETPTTSSSSASISSTISRTTNRQPAVRVHFVANVDSDDINSTLAQCQPGTTLFIISSKGFSTLETLNNAELAKRWLLQKGIKSEHLGSHFIAVTEQTDKALAWGIDRQRILELGEWIGGRFSLWSAMGLPIAIALGTQRFKELLSGAAAMDEHFEQAPLRENLPLLHGLINIWQINFWGCSSRAVLPYVHKLQKLPDYLQQLIMESLGKSVHQNGDALNMATGQVIWGSEETNGQHSFHQLLLQGTERIPTDFIVSLRPHCNDAEHRKLYANCLAQSQVLMSGAEPTQADNDPLASHRTIAGDRPSNTLILDELSPHCLGALLAFYEHSVYVQSVVWGINPFDQWGVEEGKHIGKSIEKALSQEAYSQTKDNASRHKDLSHDSSTHALIERYKTHS